eukprot:Hpha_TRINITY_DN11291_c0_g1::TRINITY_DN11291_c0_g1_i1::g.167373::m.167373
MLLHSHPIWLMYWYGTCTVFSLSNYVSWIRYQDEQFGVNTPRAYVTFVVITLVVYISISGVCFFWAQFYCKDDREGRKKRRSRVHLGMFFIYFLSDTPLFFLDLRIVYYHGWQEEIQGITFVLKLLSWLLGTFFVWFIYMYRATKWLHKKTGGDSRPAPPLPGGSPNRNIAAAEGVGVVDF